MIYTKDLLSKTDWFPHWTLTDILDDSLWYYTSDNNLLYACITEPHSGTDYKWMLRIANARGFNKWGYAQIEEFFESLDDSCEYFEKFDTKKGDIQWRLRRKML